MLAAFDRVRLAIARGGVGGERQPPWARLGANICSVTARAADRVSEDQVVVLLPAPALRREVRRADEPQQRLAIRDGRLDALGRDRRLESVGPVRPVIEGRLVAE